MYSFRYGESSIEEIYEALTDLVGPEVTKRLRKNEAIAEINRTIRSLPRDIGIKLAKIINDIAAPLSQSGASPKVFVRAGLNGPISAGLKRPFTAELKGPISAGLKGPTLNHRGK